jgi:hypothetical protein
LIFDETRAPPGRLGRRARGGSVDRVMREASWVVSL